MESVKFKYNIGMKNFKRILFSARFKVFIAIFIERMLWGLYMLMVPVLLILLSSATRNMINTLVNCKDFIEICPYLLRALGPFILYLYATVEYILFLKSQLHISYQLWTTLDKGVPKHCSLEVITNWENTNFIFLLIEIVMFINLANSMRSFTGFFVILVLRALSLFLIGCHKKRFIQESGQVVANTTTVISKDNLINIGESTNVFVISGKALSPHAIQEMGLMKSLAFDSNTMNKTKKILYPPRAHQVFSNIGHYAYIFLRGWTLMAAALTLFLACLLTILIIPELNFKNKEFTSLSSKVDIWPLKELDIYCEEKSVTPIVRLIAVSIALLLVMWVEMCIILGIRAASHKGLAKSRSTDLIDFWELLTLLNLVNECQVFFRTLFLDFNMSTLVAITILIALRVLLLVVALSYRNQLCPIMRQVAVTPTFKDEVDHEKQNIILA